MQANLAGADTVIVATVPPKAREAKPEDFIDARLVGELEKTGFMDWL
jgi:hypothetical protein